jgi:hypothetical protein
MDQDILLPLQAPNAEYINNKVLLYDVIVRV